MHRWHQRQIRLWRGGMEFIISLTDLQITAAQNTGKRAVKPIICGVNYTPLGTTCLVQEIHTTPFDLPASHIPLQFSHWLAFSFSLSLTHLLFLAFFFSLFPRVNRKDGGICHCLDSRLQQSFICWLIHDRYHHLQPLIFSVATIGSCLCQAYVLTAAQYISWVKQGNLNMTGWILLSKTTGRPILPQQ